MEAKQPRDLWLASPDRRGDLRLRHPLGRGLSHGPHQVGARRYGTGVAVTRSCRQHGRHKKKYSTCYMSVYDATVFQQSRFAAII